MLCCVVCWMGIGAEERVMVRGSEKRMMARGSEKRTMVGRRNNG